MGPPLISTVRTPSRMATRIFDEAAVAGCGQ